MSLKYLGPLFYGPFRGLLQAIFSGFFSLGRLVLRGPRQRLNRVARKEPKEPALQPPSPYLPHMVLNAQ